MGFKLFDKQSYILNTANSFAKRHISKREFLKKLSQAGLGLSAYSAATLGAAPYLLSSNTAHADQGNLSDEEVYFLKQAGKPFKGTTVKVLLKATPTTIVINQLKQEFTNLTGIDVNIEIVHLEELLSRTVEDFRDQLGSHDLYYSDRTWNALFSQDVIDPLEYYDAKPDLAMPNFYFDDFPKLMVEGLSLYQGRWVGIPIDTPIFILMYRRDILLKHGLRVPETYDEFLKTAAFITEAEKHNSVYGVGLQAKGGHYSLETDWAQAVWGHGGSIFSNDKKFAGHDEQAIAGLQWYQDLAKVASPSSLKSSWDGQFHMLATGQVAMAQSWSGFFPLLNSELFNLRGKIAAAPPLHSSIALRSRSDVAFDEIPNWAHQGGSNLILSRHSKNIDAAWLFMQWVCSKDVVTRCSLIGGFAPVRRSSYDDPLVKGAQDVQTGSKSHFAVVREVIEKYAGAEPDMPLWDEIARNQVPTELGKLLTGQAYDSNAKTCMDAVAKIVDKKIKEGGFL